MSMLNNDILIKFNLINIIQMIWIVNIEISKNRNKEIKDIESKNIGE